MCKGLSQLGLLSKRALRTVMIEADKTVNGWRGMDLSLPLSARELRVIE